MSVIEIVSLVCLFILFLIMFFVVKNCLVLMHLWRQRAERDGAVMDVQDRENPTLDTPLQPRVGDMAPMGMHLIPRQKGVQESGGNYIDTAIDTAIAALSSYSYSQFLDVKNDLFYRSIKCLHFQSLLLICAI